MAYVEFYPSRAPLLCALKKSRCILTTSTPDGSSVDGAVLPGSVGFAGPCIAWIDSVGSPPHDTPTSAHAMNVETAREVLKLKRHSEYQ